MLVLCIILSVALCGSWIYFLKSKKPASTQTTLQIESKDNDILTLAFARLSEMDFVAVKNGDQSPLLAKIEEVKAERIPDYEFLKATLAASTQGVEAACEAYFSYMEEGETYLLGTYMKDWRRLQSIVNQTQKQLNAF